MLSQGQAISLLCQFPATCWVKANTYVRLSVLQ